MRSSLTSTALLFTAFLTTPDTIAQPALDAPEETVAFEVDLSLPKAQLYASVQDQARIHCKSDSGSSIFDPMIRRKCRKDLTAQVMAQIGALDYAILNEAEDAETRTDG